MMRFRYIDPIEDDITARGRHDNAGNARQVAGERRNEQVAKDLVSLGYVDVGLSVDDLHTAIVVEDCLTRREGRRFWLETCRSGSHGRRRNMFLEIAQRIQVRLDFRLVRTRHRVDEGVKLS